MSLLLALTGGGGGAVNYTLVCASGSYTYTGQAANLTVARRLALSAGAYTYAGQTANLTVDRRLSLAAGAYSYAGQEATLGLERKLALSAGAYAYSGVAADLRVERNLALSAGSYAYTGFDAVLSYVPGASDSGAGSNKKKPRRIHPRYIYERPDEIPEKVREKKKLAAFIAKVLEPVPELKPLEFSAAWVEKPSGIEDAMAAVKRAEADYRRAREIEDEDEWLLLML